MPPRNFLGFGTGDFVELGLAALLVALTWRRAGAAPAAPKFAARTGWCMLLLASLPVLLRLALLPHYPVPVPAGADDFGYLLLADTLSHARLANPSHPMHRFFEAVFVLQEPTYSSIFTLGQGIVLALGQVVFREPWAGVLVSMAALPALCYWMLRGWTTPGWALLGGLLAVVQFGPLNPWMNSYWGGAVSALAGCLIFGALPRGNALCLGAGLALQLLTRPYEFLVLAVAVLVFRLPRPRELAAMALFLLPAAALVLAQNRAVTGNWTTLPYMASRYQYGVPAAFTFQHNPVPHRALTSEQQLDYQAQVVAHGEGTDTPARYLRRLFYRVRFYRFFLLAPLYLALPALWKTRFRKPALALLVFALGTNFYPYFYPQYVAAATCLFILAAVSALERLPIQSARVVLLICAAHFLFWYGVRVAENTSLTRYESWNFVNHGDRQGRIAVNRRLEQSPGTQLVFVRYWPEHRFEEWIHNAARIDAARIVWAADLGPEENEKLRAYYPARTPWLLEPDATPPKLVPYQVPAKGSPFLPVQ